MSKDICIDDCTQYGAWTDRRVRKMMNNIIPVGHAASLLLGGASIYAILQNSILIGMTLMYAFILVNIWLDRRKRSQTR